MTKYGHESRDFFVRNRKKRASYRLFWPIIECSFNRIYVFLTNHVHDSRERQQFGRDDVESSNAMSDLSNPVGWNQVRERPESEQLINSAAAGSSREQPAV